MAVVQKFVHQHTIRRIHQDPATSLAVLHKVMAKMTDKDQGLLLTEMFHHVIQQEQQQNSVLKEIYSIAKAKPQIL